jgi:hypothetical protein
MMKRIACVTIAWIAAFAVHSQPIQGTYAIKNVATGMVLRIKDANTANGTPLVAYSPVNWKCVTWDFKHIEGQTYQLTNLFSSKTFQPKQPPQEGVVMEEQPVVVHKETQYYEFIPAEGNSYMIRMKSTDLYLTPEDEKGAANTGILLAKKKAGKVQTWVLVEQHPTM